MGDNQIRANTRIQSGPFGQQSHPEVWKSQVHLNSWASTQAYPTPARPLEMDGIMGPKTRAALRTFQRAHQLPETGQLDPRTQGALEQQLSLPEPELAQPIMSHPDHLPTASVGLTQEHKTYAHLEAKLQQRTPGNTQHEIISPDEQIQQLLKGYYQKNIQEYDQEIFARVQRANNLTESGGKALWSTMATTAGVPASYGRGQLTIDAHLEALKKLSNSELQALGLNQDQLQNLTRKLANIGLWNRVTRGVPAHKRNVISIIEQRLGIDVRKVRRLAQEGDWTTLIDRYGDTFEQTTGISKEQLGVFAATHLFYKDEYQTAFEREYRALTGETYTHHTRQPKHMASAVDQIAKQYPELNILRQSLNGESMGLSLNGRAAEHLKGWQMRAAFNAWGEGPTRRLLKRIDPLTTQIRNITNFNAAAGVVLQPEMELPQDQQALFVGLVARIRHGFPGNFKRIFGNVNNIESLEAALKPYRSALHRFESHL